VCERELMTRAERLRRRLEIAGAPRREATPRALPVLESVRDAAPCPQTWDRMVGAGAIRWCAPCAKPFYDLSAMPAEQAEALLVCSAQAPGGLFRRRDGTLAAGDCPKGVARRRQARIEMTFLALLVAGIGVALLASSTGAAGPSLEDPGLPLGQDCFHVRT
jgi:hypothetical protein